MSIVERSFCQFCRKVLLKEKEVSQLYHDACRFEFFDFNTLPKYDQLFSFLDEDFTSTLAVLDEYFSRYFNPNLPFVYPPSSFIFFWRNEGLKDPIDCNFVSSENEFTSPFPFPFAKSSLRDWYHSHHPIFLESFKKKYIEFVVTGFHNVKMALRELLRFGEDRFSPADLRNIFDNHFFVCFTEAQVQFLIQELKDFPDSNYFLFYDVNYARIRLSLEGIEIYDPTFLTDPFYRHEFDDCEYLAQKRGQLLLVGLFQKAVFQTIQKIHHIFIQTHLRSHSNYFSYFRSRRKLFHLFFDFLWDELLPHSYDDRFLSLDDLIIDHMRGNPKIKQLIFNAGEPTLESLDCINSDIYAGFTTYSMVMNYYKSIGISFSEADLKPSWLPSFIARRVGVLPRISTPIKITFLLYLFLFLVFLLFSFGIIHR